MKILYITPRPFGVAATPGTYLAIEGYSKFHEVHVISRKYTDSSQFLTFIPSGKFFLTEIDFSSRWASPIKKVVFSFKPDVVCIATGARWWIRITRLLREILPRVLIILEVKSPPLTSEEQLNLIQKESSDAQVYLDGIITPSKEVARTWLPNIKVPLLEHPLMIDFKGISKKELDIQKISKTNIKCVFAGSMAHKRQLNKLLILISKLPPRILKSTSFDFFGEGAAREQLEAKSKELGIFQLINFKGAISQKELYRVYSKYDIGIAWVPRHLYDCAPSLKLNEYCASGIVPFATKTSAHLQYEKEGFRIYYFNEDDENQFAQLFDTFLHSPEVVSECVENNIELARNFDYLHTIQNTILPFYKKLFQRKVYQYAITDTQIKRQHKVLFISPRPYGVIATPGTYLTTQAYNEIFNLLVICHQEKSSDVIVHEATSNLNLIKIDFNRKNYINKILSLISNFSPDLICIASWPEWDHVAEAIKSKFPEIMISLEIKSPTNARRGQEKRLVNATKFIDLIIAPSREMVESWIKTIDKPFLQHRSVINSKLIERKIESKEKIYCKKFIVSGSLSRKRKINVLLQFIASIPSEILKNIRFDFYGDGPARDELIELSIRLGLNKIVTFMGAVSQKNLLKTYSYYDAGIAWVPNQLYGGAPSLKLIEYCAAGILPLATNNRGHRMLSEAGFGIKYFEEEQNSFVSLMQKLYYQGVDYEFIKNNCDLATLYDYVSVVNNEIAPFYCRYLDNSESTEEQKRIIASWANSISTESWVNSCSKILEYGTIEYEKFIHSQRMAERLIHKMDL